MQTISHLVFIVVVIIILLIVVVVCFVLNRKTIRTNSENNSTAGERYKLSTRFPIRSYKNKPITFQHDSMLYFFGCYQEKYQEGCNLGDYMYKDIFLHYFKNTPITVDHKNHFSKYSNILKKEDIVIFGGGGLLYDSQENSDYFKKCYNILKKVKCSYYFLSIGFQFSKFKFEKKDLSGTKLTELIPFIENAKFIYCRSIIDEIIFRKYNKNSKYAPDLCFSLFLINLLPPRNHISIKKNLITIGSFNHFKTYFTILRQLIEMGFVHYHLVFSKDDEFDISKWKEFSSGHRPILMKENSILNYKDVFENSSYVYTTRFHGFCFAKLLHVEHIIPILPTFKIATFVNHNEIESKKQLDFLKNIL